MAKIANVALTDTFNTWRTRSNQTFDRVSQFAINNSSLYANTLTANSSFTSKGLATFNGRATVGTNLTVSGNTTLGAAGKTITTTGALSHTGALSATNLTISGNTTFGGAGKVSNTTGWFGVAGRATVSTNLFVGANTTVMGRLGVGTASPSVKIHSSSVTSGDGIMSEYTGSGQYAAAAVRLRTGVSTANHREVWLQNYVSDASNVYGAFGIAQMTAAGSFVQTLATYDMNNNSWVFNTAGTERLRIAGSGEVTACNSMTVTKNAVISGNTSVGGRLAIGLASASADQPLHVYTTAAAALYNHVQHSSSSYNAGVQYQNGVTSWYTYTAATSGNYEVYGGTSAAVQFTIAPSGAVTIAKNATLSTNLSVTGNTSSNKMTVSSLLTVSGNTVLNGTTTDRSNALSQTLTDGATITWDTSLGRVATLTLGAAGRTMAAPTNLKVGTYILRVYQDATGSRTITSWNAVFKWTAAVAPVLSTGAGKLDIITFFSDGTNLYGSYLPDMR
jgi:hypothetical protein